MSKDYSSNDMRSMALNPNSSHYQAAQDNRSNQLNSNNSAYWSSRGDSSYDDFDSIDSYIENRVEPEFDLEKTKKELQYYFDNDKRFFASDKAELGYKLAIIADKELIKYFLIQSVDKVNAQFILQIIFRKVGDKMGFMLRILLHCTDF